MEKREWFKGLDPWSRIAVRTEGRPPHRYAVRLEVLVEGSWRTIHLFDNAHGGHDEHRYVGDAKQPAREFFLGAATRALPAAIGLIEADWPAIIKRWREKRT